MSFRVAEGFVEVTMDRSKYDADLQRLKTQKLDLKVLAKLDDTAARTQLAALTKPITLKVQATLDDAAVKARIAELSETLTIRLDDTAARASLDTLTRDRVVPIMAVVSTAQATADLQQLTAPMQVAVVPALHMPSSQELSDYLSHLQPLVAAAASSATSGATLAGGDIGPRLTNFVATASAPIEIPITAKISFLAQFRVNRWRRQISDAINIGVVPRLDATAASVVRSELQAFERPIDVPVRPEWDSAAAGIVQAHLHALQDPLQIPVEPDWDSAAMPVLAAHLEQLRETINVKVTPEFDEAAGHLVAAHLDAFRIPVDVPIRPTYDDAAGATVWQRLHRLANPMAAVVQTELASVPFMLAGTLLDRLARRRTAEVDVRVEQSQVPTLTHSLDQVGAKARAGTAGLSVFAGASRLLMASAAGAIPTLVSFGQAIISMGPAAAVAAPAIGSLVSMFGALKVGLGGISGAFKQAFAPAVGGAGGAAGATHALADAQQQLKTAIRDAGDANRHAIQQVAAAERDLTTAQRQERQAQLDLIAARKDAAQQLEDYRQKLVDGELDHRQAVLDVQQAKEDLDKTLADPKATELQKEQARLASDQAVQHLKEQEVAQARLKEEAAAAAAAGVDGNERVAQATQDVADAQQDVTDKTLALSEARISADRTAEDAALRIAQAQQGIADAMQSAGGGASGMANAMAKLAPSAREFVDAVIALKPAWDALQLDVQQTLFEGIGAKLTSVAQQVLPDLRAGLVGTAGVLNQMGLNALDAVDKLSKTGTLKQAFAGINEGLKPLQQVPGQLITMFGQLTAAAGPAFLKVTSMIGETVGSFGKRLSESFESGKLTETINAALGLVKQLGKMLGDVAGTLGNVLKAAAGAGGDALGMLGEVFSELRRITAMPEVQGALTSLFKTLNLLAATVAPLFGQALMALGPVIQTLAPPVQALISALGSALSPIIGALGPILVTAAQAIGTVVTALLPLLPVISQLVVSLLPVLNPLLQAVATIAGQLAPVIALVAQTFAAVFLPVINTLISTVLPPLVQILTTIIEAVFPVLTALLTALQPALTDMSAAFVQLAVALAPVLLALAELIGPILSALMPVLLPIIDTIGKLASIFVGELANVITTIVVPALRMITQFLNGDFHGAWDSAKELVRGVVMEVVRLIAELPFKIINALIDLGGTLLRVFGDAFVKLTIKIGQHGDDIKNFFRDLPGNIVSALGDLGNLLADAGRRLISGLIKGIKGSMGSLGNVLGDVTSYIAEHKGPPEVDAILLTPAGESIMDSLMGGLDNRLPALRGKLSGITAAISGTVTGTGPTLPLGSGQVVTAPSVPFAGGMPAVAAPTGGSVRIDNITVNAGSLDMASPAERRRIADALVAEIKDALRDYDRGRAR